jgi:hypothetical protein
MISLKIMSSAALIALVLPMAAPTASFAQGPNIKGAGGGKVGVPSAGGGGPPAMRFNPGGSGQPVARLNPGVSGPPVARFNQGVGGPPVASFNPGVGGPPVAHFNGGGARYRDSYRHHGGGFVPGLAAGAIIGGVIASPGYGYYYGGPAYYDDQYYDDGAVVVAPAPAGDDAVAYCMQTYRSYDPPSGTYLGYDGLRHPCP